MVLRFLMRYLANNEQLVQRLAESYPVRRAAQIAVSFYYRGKNVAEQQGLHELTPEKFKSFIGLFKRNLREGIEDAKQELKKRK